MSNFKLKGPFIKLSDNSISDDDFEYDARINIDGDFGSVDAKKAYVSAILQALNEPAALSARITDLERTNLLLADQLKKREGMWLAPVEPDDDMLVSGQEAFACVPRGPLEDCKESHAIYKAMRDNWLSRNK